jgi:F-type H+-transporting ATPase subunit b
VELNIPTFLGQTIAMIVFVWFCMKFVWPPIMGMLEERQEHIADGLAAADKGNRALEEAEAEKGIILDGARGQAREIIDQANTRATGIVDEARTEAGGEKDRIVASAQAEAEQESNRAREELRGQVGALAIAGAEKIIQREIDAVTHKDLLDKLAAEI